MSKPDRLIRKFQDKIELLNENNVDSFIRKIYDLYKEYWTIMGDDEGKIKFYYRHSKENEGAWFKRTDFEDISVKVYSNVLENGNSEKRKSEPLGIYFLNKDRHSKALVIDFEMHMSNKSFNLSMHLGSELNYVESKYLFLPKNKGLYLNETINAEVKISSEMLLLK